MLKMNLKKQKHFCGCCKRWSQARWQNVTLLCKVAIGQLQMMQHQNRILWIKQKKIGLHLFSTEDRMLIKGFWHSVKWTGYALRNPAPLPAPQVVEAFTKPWTASSSAYTAGTKIAHTTLLLPPCELCGKEHWSRILCSNHPHSVGQPQQLRWHLGIWRTGRHRLHIIPIMHCQVLPPSRIGSF